MVVIFLLLCFSCKSRSNGLYTYHQPENINDGFIAGTLVDADIDPYLITVAADKILAKEFKEVHSMLIFRNSRLVFEEYFRGHIYKWDAPYHLGEDVEWDKSLVHDIKSATKSITSTCIGIAIGNGFIDSVNQSIFDYLPEYQKFNTDGKDKITIEHLLTMTSGLEWDEWNSPLSSTDNDIIGLWVNYKDPIVGILGKPLNKTPGTSFTYSGGNMIVLGEIIKNATKMKIDEFSKKFLFDPLGIEHPNWSLQYDNGTIESASSLEITPRDMLKIGVTFLNRGIWKGKRIVSEKWVEKSSEVYRGNKWINVPGEPSGFLGYSYSWWTKTYSKKGMKVHMFSASGWGGQHIMVLPELDTVVVFTGSNYLTYRPPFKILEKYILPAIK